MVDPENTLDPAWTARLARRCSEQPEFLGYWLELYRETEGLSATGLARHLGCDLQAMDQLALCLRPRPERRAVDLERLATRFGADRKRLAAVLLQAEAYSQARSRAPEAARSHAPGFGGVFAAACDRVEESEAAPYGEAGTVDQPEEPLNG